MTPFRRAFIDRPRQQVVIEARPHVFYTLPGSYNPDAVIQRVIAARGVDLSKWEPFQAE